MSLTFLILAGLSLASLALGAVVLGFVLSLRRKIDRLLKLPQAQPSKIAGESPKDRRARFLAAHRLSST